MGRPESPPCPMGCKNKFGQHYKMHRLYIKKRDSFVAWGWVCLRCGTVMTVRREAPQVLNTQRGGK